MPGTQAQLRAAKRMEARLFAKLAEDLARLIADAGLTPSALAREAGVSHAFLSRILAAKARPSVPILIKLAVPLGADLSARLYPNTGPTIRDRHQARIVEHLLDVRHARWRPHTEVDVRRPARGWIDVVLEDVRDGLLVATEVESDLRRIEQTVRWSKEKAESLPSSSVWPTGDVAPDISQLLIARRTRANRRLAHEFRHQLGVAFPGHPEDAIRALTTLAPWPGSALVWATVDARGVRLLPTRE